jgi:hypothetical protein
MKKDRKLAQIRARSSYLLFQRLHDFLRNSPGIPEILRKFHDVLDAKSAFGSRRNAECAAESLELVLRDNGADGEPGEQKQAYGDGART